MSGNTVSNGNYYFIDWDLNSQSISGNSSNISWSAYWRFNSSDAQLDDGNAYLSGSRWDNGGRVYNYSGNFSTRSLKLAGGSFTIGHNSDGTKSLSVSGGVTQYSGERSSGSASWSLPTIPRASTPTSNKSSYSIVEGESITVNTNRASSSFTHTLQIYRYNGDGVWKQWTGITTSKTFVLTADDIDDIASIIPNSNSTTMYFRLITYNGSTNLGTKDILRSFSFPAGSVNPVFDDTQITYEDTDAGTVAITTDDQLIVQNQSNLEASFTAATGQLYATISNYKVTLNSDVQNKTAASTIDYGTVNLSEDTPITIEVTDSRGNKTTVSKTITVLPWQTPRAIITANRVNNYEDDTEVKAQVTIDSIDGHNSITELKARYKKTTDVTWSEQALTDNTISTISMDKLFQWNLEIVVTDEFGTTTYVMLVSKGIPIVFIDNQMLNMGISKFPVEGRMLDVGGDIYQNDHAVASLDDEHYYTAGATWTKPDGLKYVIVEVQAGGGGGGGGSRSGSNVSIGYGGGAGGYSRKKIMAADLGSTETVTVGSGGAGATGGSGGNGGNSSFGSHCTANGGSGGSRYYGTATSGYYDGTPGAAAGTGDFAIGGGDGGKAERDSGNPNQLFAGDGGNSFYGGGGSGAVANGNGRAAKAYGGGGGGGACFTNSAAQNGGAGGGGIVIVHEYY